ncbi:hypothetical protein [Yersinia phage vB_YenM_P744]
MIRILFILEEGELYWMVWLDGLGGGGIAVEV